MKKYRLLIIGLVGLIALVTFFFLYVTPYEKRIQQFDKQFKIYQESTENTCKNLTATNSIEEFTKALNELLLLPLELNAQQNNMKSLQNESNFIKNIWCKINISQNDIDIINEAIQQTYIEIPKLVTTIISSDSKTRKYNIENSTELMDLYTILDKTKVQYDSLFLTLGNIIKSRDFEGSISFTSLQKDKAYIEEMGNKSIETLIKMHDGQLKIFMESLFGTFTMKDASQLTNNYLNWIKLSKNAINISLILNANKKECQSLNINLDKDLETIKDFCMMFDRIIDSEKNANEILLQALAKMDEANNRLNNLEKFARSDDIKTVYMSWENAEEDVVRAKFALSYKVSGSDKKTIWENLVSKPRNNIETIHSSVLAHKNYVGEQYVQAVNEESTIKGDVTRTAQRAWDRTKRFIGQKVQQASNSRIAKELSISVKLLILGTKAFYDLQNPNVDPLTWALSYEGDVNNIMNETDQVMRMDGPSITGKNTIIEDFVNIAYEQSFNK
jgi:hypothetical protein